MAPVRRRRAEEREVLMKETENQRTERGHEGARRGQENWKVSLLVNDLLICSLSENAIPDLRREKVDPDNRIQTHHRTLVLNFILDGASLGVHS